MIGDGFLGLSIPPRKSRRGTWSPTGEQAYLAFPIQHVRPTESISHEKYYVGPGLRPGNKCIRHSRTACSCNGVVLPRKAAVGPGLRPGNKCIRHSRTACSCNGVVLPRKAAVGPGLRPGNKYIRHSSHGMFARRSRSPTKSHGGTWSPTGEKCGRHSRTACSCNGVVLPRKAAVGPGLRPGNKRIWHSPYSMFGRRSRSPTKSDGGAWSPTGEHVYLAFAARHVLATD